MCGFTGCIFNNNINFDFNHFQNINNLLSHRGPDNTSALNLENGNQRIYLGFNRLSIRDLSSNGNQPMFSKNQQYVILFNGEIYNHIELIKDLNNSNFNFTSSSDTEVLLEYFVKNGSSHLDKIEGMYAFAIYDIKNKIFHLARDRVGEKPLYLYFNKNCFGFSSDLKTISNFPNFNKKISNTAFYNYLIYNYIPNPQTIYKNCFKLPQATYLKIDLNNFSLDLEENFKNLKSKNGINIKKYWNIKFSNKNNNSYSFDNELDNLDKLLNESVKKQIVSDVPVGTFLSSGIDSALITSVASKYIKNLNTFSIGFNFDQYDESKKSKLIAKHLNSFHNEHIFTKNDLIDNITKIPEAFSEPFADSSQLPTMLVSQLASKSVKVVMTGDGGDELFGGYNRYIYYYKFKYIFNSFNKLFINNFKKFTGILPYKIKLPIFSLLLNKKINKYELEKILNKLESFENDFSYYYSMISQNYKINDIENINNKNKFNLKALFNNRKLSSVEKMMYADFLTYLPDDILCKVDRSSMFYSLETRTPYLDRNIIEYIFNKPLSLKVQKKQSKVLLRSLLSKYLPTDLIEKNKYGFAIPLSQWLRGDLREWSNDILINSNSILYDLIEKKEIKKILNNHFEFKENNEHKIWSLIQFSLWNKHYNL